MDNYIIKDGELYHYGVPGMKWGIRKARKTVATTVKKTKKVNEKVANTTRGAIKKTKKNNQKAIDTTQRAIKKVNNKVAKDTAKLVAKGKKIVDKLILSPIRVIVR